MTLESPWQSVPPLALLQHTWEVLLTAFKPLNAIHRKCKMLCSLLLKQLASSLPNICHAPHVARSDSPELGQIPSSSSIQRLFCCMDQKATVSLDSLTRTRSITVSAGTTVHSAYGIGIPKDADDFQKAWRDPSFFSAKTK